MRGDGSVGLCRVRDEGLNHLQLMLSDRYEKGLTGRGGANGMEIIQEPLYGLFVMKISHKKSIGVRSTCSESRLDCL